MSIVRQRIEELEKKTRDELIEQEERAKKVSKMFFDERMSKMYPLANQISIPETYETLNTNNIITSKADALTTLYNNLNGVSNKNEEFVNNIYSYVNNKYDASGIDYLNNSWTDFKTALKKQYKSSVINVESFKTFLDTYMKKNYLINFGTSNNIGASNPNGVPSQVSFNASDVSQSFNPTQNSVPSYMYGSVNGSNMSYNDNYQQEFDNYDDFDEQMPALELIPEYEEKKFPLQTFTKIPKKGSTKVKLMQHISKYIDEAPFYLQKVNDFEEQEGKPVEDMLTNELRKLETYLLKEYENEKTKFEAQEALNKRDWENQNIITPSSGFRSKKQSSRPKKRFMGKGIQGGISDKFYVDLTHLNNDKLALKYKSTGKAIIKPTNITNVQKVMIKDILLNKFDNDKYKKLSTEDKKFILNFAAKAGVKNIQNINDDIEHLNTRFEILIGEYHSGNDSKEVLKMIMQISEKLYNLKQMTRLEYLTLKEQLQSLSEA